MPALAKANIVSRDTPLLTARMFHTQQHPYMICYQEDWLDWNGSSYQMRENKTIEAEVLRFLDKCKANVAYEVKDAAGNVSTKYKAEQFNPKEADVQQVVKLLAHDCNVEPGVMKPPFFLDGGTGEHAGLDPANLISHQGGLLDITTRNEYWATPQFFTRNALPIKYNPAAECPVLRKFLLEVFDGNADLVALMCQWFGHLITTDVTIQRLLYLQGVPRGGKGTIGRVLDALVGQDNVASHKLKDVATNFDLESMIGKSLLKVSEVNAGNKQILEDAISVINGITGEDRQHIQRKYKGALDLAFKLHVVLMGNGYPDFGEHAAAFAARADVIPFRKTFVGREDDTLTARLLDELPGILNFALDGLKDLREGETPRKFKIVAAAEDAKRQMMNSGNTVHAFVVNLCELGDWSVEKGDLFKAYLRYCITINAYAFSEPVFYKKLKEAFPGLQNTRPTVAGERENFISGIRLREMGPPTTITKTFWLDLDLTEMFDEPVILRDPITGEEVEVIENEF